MICCSAQRGSAVALEEVCYSTQQGSLGLSTRFAVVLYEVTVVLNEVAVFTEFFGSLIGEGIHASAYPVEPPVVVVPKSRTGLLSSVPNSLSCLMLKLSYFLRSAAICIAFSCMR